MSFIENVTKAMSVHKRKLGAVGIIAGLVGLQYAGLNPIGNIFRTPGVKQIEDRYTSAGGSPTHLPASATPLGRKDQVMGNTEQQQGVGTEKFAKTEGDQMPAPSPFDKAWYGTHYGHDKGK
ncbi:hypothetical protein MMC30_001094 [Trapelia coarctata]|nr:hypothetical protein [Trapelia coarctata]